MIPFTVNRIWGIAEMSIMAHRIITRLAMIPDHITVTVIYKVIGVNMIIAEIIIHRAMKTIAMNMTEEMKIVAGIQVTIPGHSLSTGLKIAGDL